LFKALEFMLLSEGAVSCERRLVSIWVLNGIAMGSVDALVIVAGRSVGAAEVAIAFFLTFVGESS
jgi:hypothetical protein